MIAMKATTGGLRELAYRVERGIGFFSMDFAVQRVVAVMLGVANREKRDRGWGCLRYFFFLGGL